MNEAIASSIVCVVPCYNVARYCEAVIVGCFAHADYVIAVDDGSEDATLQLLMKLKRRYEERLTVLSMPDNQGKGTALLRGMKHALEVHPAAMVVTLDSDGQHDPDDIPQLIESLKGGAALVIGQRNFSKMPFKSRFGNQWSSWLMRILYRKSPTDTQSGFRAFNADFCRYVTRHAVPGRYETELHMLFAALDRGFPIGQAPIRTIYSEGKRYSYFNAVGDSLTIFKILVKAYVRRMGFSQT